MVLQLQPSGVDIMPVRKSPRQHKTSSVTPESVEMTDRASTAAKRTVEMESAPSIFTGFVDRLVKDGQLKKGCYYPDLNASK